MSEAQEGHAGTLTSFPSCPPSCPDRVAAGWSGGGVTCTQLCWRPLREDSVSWTPRPARGGTLVPATAQDPHAPALSTVLFPPQVPDEHFSTLLDYLEGLKGSARELTVQKAEALMRELDEADPEARDAQLGKMERLRQVLQLLS